MALEISHWFPPEITREILLKLPVESLLRCKSVCKEWFSLISDHYFIKTHNSLSSTNFEHHHRLIYTSNYEHENDLYICPLYNLMFDKCVSNVLLLENPLKRPQPDQMIYIVSSCNGLMCLYVEDDDNCELFIYNPSTRIWNGLPSRKRDKYIKLYSFGYDESTNDYKIVELAEVEFLKNRPYFMKVQIYSLRTGKWKNLGDFSYECPLKASGIFSNGALHWVTHSNVLPVTRRIVSLDLAKETYGEVLIFDHDEDNTYLTLVVLGECLYVLCDCFESHVDLWVMKVYGLKDSWTKLASIPYLTNDWIHQFRVPSFISYDGKVLFQCKKEFVIYDLKDSSVSCIQDFKCSEVCIVVESLVSPFPALGLADNNDDEN